MIKNILSLFLLWLPYLTIGQVIYKPTGCFAGTNGTNSSVLLNAEVRGVLLVEKWSDIEVTPGVFDFTNLNQKINTVKTAGLKYSLAIAGGAFGSPDWLISSLNVRYHDFQYQDKNWRLPLWWDTVCIQRLTNLISQLGNQYASDGMLSHVYVTQMTVNGIEGHLNGVDMSAFALDGFTNQRWIDAAGNTAVSFANAFPDKPIVFEVHEIDHDTVIPATIINNLYNNVSLCDRIGLGMWWISGKTSYQSDLLNYIQNFQGDKYAQVIGRSDQVERFQDNLYSSVFAQAKQLGIRYIEPWPYEFQYHTHDSLLQDFNVWADANFPSSDTCLLSDVNDDIEDLNGQVVVSPNPTKGLLTVQIGYPYQKLEISLFNINGQVLYSISNQTELDISHLSKGRYIVAINIDNHLSQKKIIKLE
jgi:hypothetical protein